MIATVKSRYNTCRKVWDTEGIGLIDDLFLKSGNVHETDIAAEQDSYTIENTRDYCGNVQYENGRLSRIMVDGGYCSAGGKFYAFVQDYRGSVRRVGNNEYTYYPDGKTKDYSAYQYNDPSQRYQFCGMERDEYNGLDLYDFHARWYDQELCQFTTMDPLCERYYDISPFAYCAGDPVNNIDPTGMVVWSTSDPDEIAKFVRQLKSTGQMSTEGMQEYESVLDTPCYVSSIREDIKKRFSVDKVVSDAKNYTTGGRASSSNNVAGKSKQNKADGFATASKVIEKSQASNISTATTVGQKTAEGVVALKPNIKYAKGVTAMAGNLKYISTGTGVVACAGDACDVIYAHGNSDIKGEGKALGGLAVDVAGLYLWEVTVSVLAYNTVLKPVGKYIVNNYVGPYVNSFNQEYESMLSSPSTMGNVMMGF